MAVVAKLACPSHTRPDDKSRRQHTTCAATQHMAYIQRKVSGKRRKTEGDDGGRDPRPVALGGVEDCLVRGGIVPGAARTMEVRRKYVLRYCVLGMVADCGLCKGHTV